MNKEIIRIRAEQNNIENRKIIETIHETKILVFVKLSKTDKPLAGLTDKKRKYKLAKLEMKEKIALWSLQKFKRIIREYYDQPYGNKLDNLDAMKKIPKNIKIFKTDSRRNKKSDQNYK